MALHDEDAVHVEPKLAVPPPPEPCPECGGTDLHYRPRMRAFLLFLVLCAGVGYAIDNPLAVILVACGCAIFFIVADRRRCLECGHTW